MKCIKLYPTQEIIDYVKNFNSDEELLRSGGIPIEMLDKYAYGFSKKDIKTIEPSKIKIKWKEDYENVIHEIKYSGLKPIEWAKKINLSKPIDLNYEDLGNGLNFYLDDGHHRYVAAKLRKKNLNVNLTIKDNPIKKITKNKLSYDDFHRCLFQEIKNIKNLIKQKLKENITKNMLKVYRCIDGVYNENSSKIQYFSVNKNYAQKFGDNCYEFTINLNNAKILNLNKWNKLFKEKTGTNGNKYNRVQGIFVIGQEVINSNYEEPLKRFSINFPNEITQKFIDEFNKCDAIYGEDAGYPNEFVFAVKNTNIITLNK